MISPPKMPGGTSKAAQFFRDHLDYTKSLRVFDTEDIAVTHTADGIGLRIRKKAGGIPGEASSVVRCRPSAVFDEYLDATIINADGGIGNTIQVALPIALRRSSYDGIGGLSYDSPGRRLVTKSQCSGFEIVWPWWYNSDHPIIVANVATGLIVADAELQYIDLNSDALHWDLEQNCFEVCDNDVATTALLAGNVTP